MTSVIPLKEKKVRSIFEKYGEISFNEFLGYFTYKYPNDWKSVIERYYNQNIKQRELGKRVGSMPNPNKYMENLYKVGLKKYLASINN